MKGRVGIKSTDKTLSFSLLWRQQSESFDIRLNGTLGVAIAHVWGGAGGVTIDVPGEGRFQADSASALLLQHTGVSLPIESLVYWVRGIPDPAADFERDDSSLVQYGWLIEYLAFNGEEPVRMRFSRADVKIMLVVKSWG